MPAAYEQIYRAVLEQIRGGKLEAGDRLPSERELAARHQVSLMTARHALAVLRDQGLVIRRVGAGTFVAPTSNGGGQRLQDPQELIHGRLTGKLLSCQLLAEGAARPEPMAGIACGLVHRVWNAGGQKVLDEQIWLPAATERELRKLGTTPLLGWLSTPGLFAHELVEATSLQGTPALRLTQTLYDPLQQPVAHRVSLGRADRFRLERIVHRT